MKSDTVYCLAKVYSTAQQCPPLAARTKGKGGDTLDLALKHASSYTTYGNKAADMLDGVLAQ